MTDDALSIVQKAIDAVDPYAAIRSNVHFDSETNSLQVGAAKSLDLNQFDDVVLVAFGKASSAMATGVLEQLSEGETTTNIKNNNIQGVVIVKDDHGTEKEQATLESHGISFLEASHPVPDARSAHGAMEIMKMVSETANSRTLVICCISGGGSALFCLPQERLTLDDLQRTNAVLLASGLSIQDMNVIRKRLEDGKGGRLAAAAYPSTVISLILSDVLGDPLDLIASGPTVPDTSNWLDAWQLVQKNNLEDKLPEDVVQILKDGINGDMPDSPSEDSAIFREGKCETIVVGNNERAVEAAATEAKRIGYDTKVLGCRVEGEAKHVANVFAAMAQQLTLQRNGPGQDFSLATLPAALISGGETTVSIEPGSDGKGGRNQELALVFADCIGKLGLRDVVLASVGTDGTDGPTDAAGAVVDGGTLERLEGSAEDALRHHDAYNFLDQVESDSHKPLIKTGPTGTNVADVCVVLIR
ncbi:Glycerate kinase [Seminavis robusta]|uniref:Glycerate kinase n=1 Tax=Seminavis robusta TaxID=568900 RepID=A0A9N8EX67_9STRA|nr:Glycerate kinase [Seminavis robusta]|eukprot:Sro2022_g311520.1 Glycerate kinase (473) ;mRNA; f:11645-13063